MTVLRFGSEEALRFSITSSLLPADVVAAEARTWRDASGGILVAPNVALPARVLEKLVGAGIERVTAPKSEPPTEVRCWAEIVPVIRRRLEDDIGQVLFVVKGSSFVDVAGELLRLGCDRLEWRTVDGPHGDGTHVIRVTAPPYYTVLRALDGALGVAAYAPSPRGQERVWCAVGCEHPLAPFLRPETGAILLIGLDPNGTSTFTTVPEGAFADIYALVDLRVPSPSAPTVLAATEPPRLRVTLRLARAAQGDVPTLWVLRDDPIPKVEKLLSALPEDVSRRLLFAVCKEGDASIVVLRTRPGARVDVEIEGEAFRCHPSVPTLHLPCETTLEPPIRRDRVRDLLAPDPDEIVWLREEGGGAFRVERAPDVAFQPLSEWVDYIIDTNSAALVPWIKSVTFDFDAFVGVDAKLEPGGPRATPDDPEKPRRKKPRPEASPPAAAARETASPAAQERSVVRSTLELARVTPHAEAEELASIEKAFFALESAPDAPARVELFGRMAPLHALLNRRQDAALCWARAMWGADDDERGPTTRAWASAEREGLGDVSVRSLLALVEPSREHVRALGVLVLDGDPEALDAAHEATLWFDRHDHLVDVRTAWLARVALSRLAGGDRLGLARARDRLLGSIHHGLSLDRDVPSFMRRAGAARDAAQVDVLAGKLDALLDRYEKTKRKRSATEADPKLTNAYVRFVVAYGAAKLGRRERASELRDSALGALPKDKIHDLLARAYVARIGQALEGRSAETPLPAEISAGLDDLAKLERYKVDRVRQCSKILEPHERLDPIAAFQRGEADPRGPEFVGLRGETSALAIERRIAEVMDQARGRGPEDRARLYDGAMDFFPQLPHERAVGHIEALLGNVSDISPPRRAAVLEEALMLAGHFGEQGLARAIFDVLEPLVAGAAPDDAASIAPLASGMLRTLRRFGLREEAQRLLGALQRAATGTATVHLVARLHTATALAYLGETERARPVFEEALTVLAGDKPVPERLVLTRALARALGTAPLNYAVAGLDALQKRLEGVTDSFNTNTHVCLSVVDYMESLVLGYASDELTVDPIARRLLDEDEYLVRRRIHRDLAG